MKTDSTNGHSWSASILPSSHGPHSLICFVCRCYYPYNDATPGFAISLASMLADAGGDATKARQMYCGLEAIVTTPSGKTVTLYVADAFDDAYVSVFPPFHLRNSPSSSFRCPLLPLLSELTPFSSIAGSGLPPQWTWCTTRFPSFSARRPRTRTTSFRCVALLQGLPHDPLVLTPAAPSPAERLVEVHWQQVGPVLVRLDWQLRVQGGLLRVHRRA